MTVRPIEIRMGGYGPPHTGFSRALKRIGERLQQRFAEQIDVKYIWNIMDLGHRADDILGLVESGIITLGYQSSSYLTDHVPELGFIDLPFLFASNEHARAAMDGPLGVFLAQKIEEQMNYRILGWFENGFRHISNRLRPIRLPTDLADMRIRVLPSDVHKRTFELLGATPLRMDLTEAVQMIGSGTIDAQENPFSNTVVYGVHRFHHFHTLTGHFYISRPIFINRDQFESWPDDLQSEMQAAVADAVAFQRGAAVEEHESARRDIEALGCEIITLTADEQHAFVEAVRPLHAEARTTYGDAMFEQLSAARAGAGT
jgi:TRAP-type transport system periplasmic protein